MHSKLIQFIALLLTILNFTAFSSAASLELSDEVRAEEFSLSSKSLALGGFDPVAYFQSGPRKGSSKITYAHQGVTYRFANMANRDAFKAEPGKYEPMYGGWCAWAMYDGGGRTEADPENYKLIDGALYVYYKGFFGDTLKVWNDKSKSVAEAKLIATAGRNWQGQVAK